MIFVACVHVVFGFYLELLLHESLMCDLRKDTLFNNYFDFERLRSCISGRGDHYFPNVLMASSFYPGDLPVFTAMSKLAVPKENILSFCTHTWLLVSVSEQAICIRNQNGWELSNQDPRMDTQPRSQRKTPSLVLRAQLRENPGNEGDECGCVDCVVQRFRSSTPLW